MVGLPYRRLINKNAPPLKFQVKGISRWRNLFILIHSLFLFIDENELNVMDGIFPGDYKNDYKHISMFCD
ncbi:Uncharacterised protein [Raoultella terrigena]|uniref:Uncharacterized protein n=1 Tax=Raoultella terrigena TaxID=577 RepID=A0A4U9D0B2_RAOTE|nr:Uncharacterised protein [Raoultella terrigena]